MAGTSSAPNPDGRLSLAEQVVLALVAEGSPHGFAVARLLAPDGEVGRVYSVARPAVYRAIDRLVEGGLIESLGAEPGDRGPKRTPVRVTAAGRRAADGWLGQPVAHIRDLRTEFLAKLAILHRQGQDPAALVEGQISVVAPIVEALADRLGSASGFDRSLALWPLRSGQAALRFLEDLRAATAPGR